MTYYNDDQQVELIKNWCKKYGVSVIAGVLLGLAILYGWQFWQKHQTQKSAEASIAYERILSDVAQGNPTQAVKEATQLVQDAPHSVYATVASLILAKLAVAQQQYPQAITHLQWVLDHSKERAYQQIARLEWARILSEQQQWDTALKTLDTVNDPAYLPSIQEVRGDILLAQGKQQQAQLAYQAALKNLATDSPLRATLLMKVNSMSEEAPLNKPRGVA